ncbi:MAG: hypothetical protein AMXMBFR84_26410 [Candidatus Hydrogenedentota bacterium]
MTEAPRRLTSAEWRELHYVLLEARDRLIGTSETPTYDLIQMVKSQIPIARESGLTATAQMLEEIVGHISTSQDGNPDLLTQVRGALRIVMEARNETQRPASV